MTKKEYQQLLKDPRWIARREQIKDRDKHTCQSCGATKYLQVHHQYYEGDNAPWDYPDDALITLCRECHNAVHKRQKQVKEKYAIVYIKPLLELNTISSITDFKVLFNFIDFAEINTNMVYLPSKRRRTLEKRLSISSSQISNSIAKLRALHVIAGTHGAYMVNPILCWKGSTDKQNDALNAWEKLSKPS